MNQTQSTASQSSAVQNPSRLETNEVLFEGLLLILQSLVKRFPYGEFLSSSIVISCMSGTSAVLLLCHIMNPAATRCTRWKITLTATMRNSFVGLTS